MRFWMATLLTDLLIPIGILINGILYLKKPVKHINWLHGYRTERSMKNQESWEFAQKHFGGVCFRLGTVLTLLTCILMCSVFGANQKIVGLLGNGLGIAEGFMMIYVLTPTEKALKEIAEKEAHAN